MFINFKFKLQNIYRKLLINFNLIGGKTTIFCDRIEIIGNEKLQEFFFKKSILDNPSFFGNPTKYEILIDHFNGVNYLNGNKYPLFFPKDMVEFVNEMPKDKLQDYYFKGVISDKRQWIKKYEKCGTILNSTYGRNSSTKYILDENYYKSMCESKFTLTPTGDCPWSYRFFESIMCFSIPILEDETDDIYRHLFKYYKNSDIHIYDQEMARYNYNILINNFTSLN